MSEHHSASLLPQRAACEDPKYMFSRCGYKLSKIILDRIISIVCSPLALRKEVRSTTVEDDSHATLSRSTQAQPQRLALDERFKWRGVRQRRPQSKKPYSDALHTPFHRRSSHDHSAHWSPHTPHSASLLDFVKDSHHSRKRIVCWSFMWSLQRYTW